MSFMQIEITAKGALYVADCQRCGASIFTHEWATWGHNEMRDAMQAGHACCPECFGNAAPETFSKAPRKVYAGRYSAPGYLDCTEWTFGTNKRRLISELREMYGDAE
jgi:hypothetical protein